MKNIISIMVISLLFLSGCSKSEEAVAHINNVKVYKLNVSMDNEKKLQATVENGNQLWRRSAKDVAHAALINEGVNVKTENCQILSENNQESIVAVKDNKGISYKVVLKKLITPDGIWTAVEIDIKEG
ncbi:MAG: hypothetical protein HZC45_01410 [Deltaproteobacteria bacterium]|nr:hypothetical protein [Deltaproteobacteria bacterium]